MKKIYILWAGNGPFLDVGKHIVCGSTDKKLLETYKNQLKETEYYKYSFFYIQEIDLYEKIKYEKSTIYR